jgi:hypothetical protein
MVPPAAHFMPLPRGLAGIEILSPETDFNPTHLISATDRAAVAVDRQCYNDGFALNFHHLLLAAIGDSHECVTCPPAQVDSALLNEFLLNLWRQTGRRL